MSHLVSIHKRDSSDTPIMKARWCASFFCRLRGLMFRRGLPGGIGLILVEGRQGIGNTMIHMFAVGFSIGVLWVDEGMQVVDKVVARPWRVYSPSKPARYIVEGSPSIVDQVSVGEKLEFRKNV